MNKSKVFLTLLFLVTTFAANAMDWFREWGQHGGGHHGGGTVNAPLDGGLLTILGLAGVAYFISRKKKKKE